MFVVFDLDGTLADIEHRVHHIRDGRSDYRTFFKLCPADIPIWPVIQTLTSHHKMGHTVEIWSGRSDEVRSETDQWLFKHGINADLLTHMRKAGDTRPDVVVKREWLDAARDLNQTPDIIYDDRDVVVAMWREEGIRCFQVAPGPF